MSSLAAPDVVAVTRPPFPLDALPPVVRAYVAALATATLCDPAVAALACLTAVAGAVGGTRRVALKPGVTEPAVVWGVVALAPGDVFDFAPVLDRVLAPLHVIQQERLDNYRSQLAAYGGEMRRWARKCQKYEEALEAFHKAKYKNSPPPRSPDPDDEPQRPTLDTLITPDLTPLAIARTLTRSTRPGVLLARPSVDAWASAVTRAVATADDPDGEFWRAAYDGGFVAVHPDPPAAPDDLAIPANASGAAVSVIGSVRTTSLVAGSQSGPGPLDRMCLVLPDPSSASAAAWSDATVPAPVGDAFGDMLVGLADLYGRSDVPFAPDAARAWADAYPQLASDWVASHAARFALLTMLVHYAQFLAANELNADDVALQIDAPALAAGIELARWFAVERSRVRGAIASAGDDRTRAETLRYVQSLGGTASVRQLMRQGPRFRSSDAARAALDSLVRAGQGVWEAAEGSKTPGLFRLTPAAGSAP